MSDARRTLQPCDNCGQPSPDGWCDVCELVAELGHVIGDLIPTLTADQVRDLRARVLAILGDEEEAAS